ncbi:MAG: hypothetical protein MUE42_00480 [Opitutaceae bacterium]|jgi:hypothetical protein|nr:hypothetical protein [Opitutaceae bacterium]
MNRPKLSFSVLAVVALVFGARQAQAQYNYLLLEAPVTIQFSVSVPNVVNVALTGGGNSRRTTPTTLPITPSMVLDDLRASGIITAPDNVGWTIVAVRPAPSDVYFVDASYRFFAVRRATPTSEIIERVAIPSTKLSFNRNYSNYVFTERFLGNLTLSATGRSTNYVEVTYRPNFVRTGTRYDFFTDPAAGITASGNAAFVFASTSADTDPVLIIAPTSMRLSGVGGVTGQRGPDGGALSSVEGLVTFTISIGAPRLVDAQDYLDVAVPDGDAPLPLINTAPPITFDFPYLGTSE